MWKKTVVASLVLGGALMSTQAPVLAVEAMQDDWAFMMSMKGMDRNHDGMVSKKEFLDMMAMTWDMNAKKMGVKGDRMTQDQFQEILMYLKAGG